MTGRWFCPRPPPITLTATVETPSSKHTSKQLLYNTQFIYMTTSKGQSWSWSYDNSTYDYICNQYISPLTLWGQTTLRRCVLDTTVCDEFCQTCAKSGVFSEYSAFLWPPRYNWTIAKNGVIHHKETNKLTCGIFLYVSIIFWNCSSSVVCLFYFSIIFWNWYVSVFVI